MSELDQAPDEGTPDNAAGTAEQAPSTQDQGQQIDWQKRYEDMRSEFDRRGTRLSEVEQQAQLVQALQSEDADLRRQAMEALGLEIVEEAQNDDYADPSEQLTQRLSALEERLAQQAAEAQQAQQIALIEQHVEQQLAALDGLSERAQKWIVNTAVALPPTPDGMPDIKGAYEEWVADMTEEKKSWASTKRTTHRVSPVGEAGSQVPDLDNRQARIDYMTQRIQANEE